MVLDVSPFGNGHAKLTPIAAFIAEPTTVRVGVMRSKLPIDFVALNNAAAAIVRRQVPFDYAFDTSDDSALYCSELAYKVLRDAGVSWTGVHTQRMSMLLASDREVITPDALARSSALATLLYWNDR